MIVVTDSGPLIHLAAVNQFRLLHQFFQLLLITPQVHEEVITQGAGRAGSLELQQALQEKWITVEEVADRALIDRLTVPNISKTDATVIATALVHHATLLLADDIAVRTVAMREGRGGSGWLDRVGPFLSGAWRFADYAAGCRVVRLS